jgi:hypothetical protein
MKRACGMRPPDAGEICGLPGTSSYQTRLHTVNGMILSYRNGSSNRDIDIARESWRERVGNRKWIRFDSRPCEIL